MNAAVHGLVLVKDALLANGAWQVVQAVAARLETLDGGAWLVTSATRLAQSRLQSCLEVHQRPRHRLVHAVGPQGAVKVNLYVKVYIKL